MKQRFPTKKDFIKILLKVKGKKTSGFLRLNEVMCKLLANLNCKQIQRLFASWHHVLHMPSIFTFHISHTIEVLYCNWLYLKAVNILTSLIKLCFVYFKFKRTNQSCSPSKLANQSMLNGALLIQMVNTSFSEGKENLCSLIEKNI